MKVFIATVIDPDMKPEDVLAAAFATLEGAKEWYRTYINDIHEDAPGEYVPVWTDDGDNEWTTNRDDGAEYCVIIETELGS